MDIVGYRLSRLFRGLGCLPLRQLIFERNRFARKYSWRPIAELSHQCVGDVVDGERRLRRILSDPGVKEDLQQEITKLFAQLVNTAAADRVQQLVGLLQQVSAQRVVSLLTFPRSGGAQLVHHRDGVDESFATLRIRCRDQPGTGGQSSNDSRMVGVRRQQHRRVVSGVRRTSRW
ncbi:Uncharacterised protein [Mycobacterium tuberculosis]|uniref:Uncharacterized protein n=1 Tax=Mycobacterium tuberculosis TaxID=1773 RepID=A0A654ZHB0_MYCTX|nr:Uncharacterised protein [Mycobacterium tuberculosis]CNV67752.1 Uncharacterised protein [Mycobacterium tuberculosis]COX21118.1 Uncharacterised protein [Mycobacterium tuberculosis]